ncbi:hypothetical protein DL93DRAFT_2090079 [Clavulina sp. PMI_390]|nr:hypothetical protein DL93DRAFT_2090079 [Clavulina sp. PMI_390]
MDFLLIVLGSLTVAGTLILLVPHIRNALTSLPLPERLRLPPKKRPSVLLESSPLNEKTGPTKSKETWNGGLSEDRVVGEWQPVQFDYPRVEADTSFDVNTAKTPSYRPFRWGKYYVTMGIRPMPWDEWLQIDNRWPHYHAIKVDRMAKQGTNVVRTEEPKTGIPGGALPAKELVHEMAEYLSRRFPQMYTVTRKAPLPGDFGWYGEGEIKTIRIHAPAPAANGSLDESGHDDEAHRGRPVGSRDSAEGYNPGVDVTYDLDVEDPMSVAGLLVQDDLALMVEGSDGRYYFQAGSICLAGFWRMIDKIGLPLEEIHTRGRVPQYETKLHLSLGRFFSKLRLDKPVVRNNYFVQVVDTSPVAASPSPSGCPMSTIAPLSDAPHPLPTPTFDANAPTIGRTSRLVDPDQIGWSDSTNGPEGVFDQGPKAPTPSSLLAGTFEPPAPTSDVGAVRLRQERQSLRRLPRSGAVVFTIRTYIDRFTSLAKEKGVPGRLASAIRSWPEDVAEYKGQELYRDAVLPYLDAEHAKQVAAGIFVEGEKSSDYPF